MRVIVATTLDNAAAMKQLWGYLNAKHGRLQTPWFSVILTPETLEAVWAKGVPNLSILTKELVEKHPDLTLDTFLFKTDVVLIERDNIGHFVFRNKYGQSNYYSTWGSVTPR